MNLHFFQRFSSDDATNTKITTTKQIPNIPSHLHQIFHSPLFFLFLFTFLTLLCVLFQFQTVILSHGLHEFIPAN